jgi:hypothetical protein
MGIENDSKEMQKNNDIQDRKRDGVAEWLERHKEMHTTTYSDQIPGFNG